MGEYLLHSIQVLEEYLLQQQQQQQQQDDEKNKEDNNKLNLKKDINPLIILCDMYQKVADIYYNNEEYNLVISSYQNAIRVWNSIPNNNNIKPKQEQTSNNDNEKNNYYHPYLITNKRLTNIRFKLGISYKSINNYNNAIKEFHESLRLRQKLLEENEENKYYEDEGKQQQKKDNNNNNNIHKLYMANTLIELGTCYIKINNIIQSEYMYKEALCIRKEILQQIKYDIAENNNNNNTNKTSIITASSFLLPFSLRKRYINPYYIPTTEYLKQKIKLSENNNNQPNNNRKKLQQQQDITIY